MKPERIQFKPNETKGFWRKLSSFFANAVRILQELAIFAGLLDKPAARNRADEGAKGHDDETGNRSS